MGGSTFGGSSLSDPFFMGVMMGLAVGATGDTEAGGVFERRGFLSFFGSLAAELGRGESPPELCG